MDKTTIKAQFEFYGIVCLASILLAIYLVGDAFIKHQEMKDIDLCITETEELIWKCRAWVRHGGPHPDIDYEDEE